MRENNKNDITDMLVDMLAVISVTVTDRMAIETFEKYHLDKCPETLFSTFIFGLVDKWLEAQDKDKSEFNELMESIKSTGIATYEEEKRGTNDI